MKSIRIMSASPKIQLANPSYNATQIISVMQKAHANDVQLLALPELCITGATCKSLFHQPTLLNAATAALEKITKASTGMDLVVIVGLPIASIKNSCKQAKIQHDSKAVSQSSLGLVGTNDNAPHNVAAVILNGEILGLVAKTQNIQNINDEFNCNPNSQLMHHNSVFFGAQGFSFSVAIGCDITHSDGSSFITVNPTSYPELATTKYNPNMYFKSKAFVCAASGSGESTTDGVYSGRCIIAYDGKTLAESCAFSDSEVIASVQATTSCGAATSDTVKLTSQNIRLHRKLEETHENVNEFSKKPIKQTIEVVQHPFIHYTPDPNSVLSIQGAGLAGRLSHTNSKAVIGVSGGLDSCLALLVTVRAYQILNKPMSEIIAITMPCFGTTAHTKNNAHNLCLALGIQCREIDITESVTKHLTDINHPDNTFDVVFENAQARMRTMLLMNVANQVEGIVVGTGSLSELALGWATYNGDHMSMYAVNSGVPKTLARHLVKYIADTCDSPELKKVLESILATKVSPELLPTPQITEDFVGPYELHDFFIYHMLIEKHTPTEIFHFATSAFEDKYESKDIVHWLKTFYQRFFSQQFKRNCLPDGPQVVDISLSPRNGFQMPSDASAQAWLAELELLHSDTTNA